MTHNTNLYAGWWVYVGLIGLGVTLVLVSLGGVGLWLGALTLVGLGLAAVVAERRGYGPRRRLVAELSERGLALRIEPPAQEQGMFIAWNQITGVRLRPRPGYWQTSVLTADQPDVWLLAGHSLALAEEIAEVANLPYDASAQTPVAMGVEHYWLQSHHSFTSSR